MADAGSSRMVALATVALLLVSSVGAPVAATTTAAQDDRTGTADGGGSLVTAIADLLSDWDLDAVLESLVDALADVFESTDEQSPDGATDSTATTEPTTDDGASTPTTTPDEQPRTSAPDTTDERTTTPDATTTPDSTTTPDTTTTTTPETTTTTAPSDDDGLDRSKVERLMHQYVNDERTERGLDALAFDADLRTIARSHSEDMATRGYFSHVSPEGDDFSDRYERAGYECRAPTGDGTYLTGGENIAQTWYDTPISGGVQYTTEAELARGIVDQWMNSSGHRSNILADAWRNEGIGIYVTDEGKVYATQNFC